MTLSPQILVADDDDLNREVMEAFLMSENYRVHLAHDGQHTLHLTESLLPDLILLDVNMPDMTGYEVCRILRQNPTTANIPVIMVTGYDTAQDRAAGMAAGANVFLPRPFSATHLLEVVADLLRKSKA
jgi:CheY-like chemotaxis protein